MPFEKKDNRTEAELFGMDRVGIAQMRRDALRPQDDSATRAEIRKLFNEAEKEDRIYGKDAVEGNRFQFQEGPNPNRKTLEVVKNFRELTNQEIEKGSKEFEVKEQKRNNEIKKITKGLGEFKDRKERWSVSEPAIVFQYMGDLSNPVINTVAAVAEWTRTRVPGGFPVSQSGRMYYNVYGNLKTGEIYGWEALKWESTGERHPINDAPIYEWRPIYDIEKVLKDPSFKDFKQEFEKRQTKR